jgi:hypothetical protein
MRKNYIHKNLTTNEKTNSIKINGNSFCWMF